MKRLLLILFILPALACSSTIAKPAPAPAQLIDIPITERIAPSPAWLEPAATATASPESCEVSAEGLHVRDAPGLEGTVIAWLRRSDHLTILPDPPVGDWVKVQTADAIIGWIKSTYCERNKP